MSKQQEITVKVGDFLRVHYRHAAKPDELTEVLGKVTALDDHPSPGFSCIWLASATLNHCLTEEDIAVIEHIAQPEGWTPFYQ